MSAHAPGPWTITHWGINAAARAIVFDGTMYPEDARLIAAAPDMLAILKDIRNAPDPYDGVGGWWEEIDDAIAKAEGRAS